MDPLVARIVYAELALESITKLRDADKTVDFESMWRSLNQYRQSLLDTLNIAQEADLELARIKGWIEGDKASRGRRSKS